MKKMKEWNDTQGREI